MHRLWLATVLLISAPLAACTPPAKPTPAQITVVQPGIEAEQRGNYGFALLTYRYWANLRVALAQYRLARMHEHGLGTEQDDGQAASWYRAASDIGYLPAHIALARLYEEGRGVPQDEAVALALYRKAAAGGEVEAHYRIGLLLAHGRGTATDPNGAATHYRIAAAGGYADARRALTELDRSPPDAPANTARGADWSLATTARDEAKAGGLARLRPKGDGKAQEQARATDTRAAVADPESELVAAFVGPDGVPDPTPVAAPEATPTAGSYRQAARQGDGEAAFRLAEAFEQGEGVFPDLVEALAWFAIAERHGYAPAASRAAQLRAELPGMEVREARRRVDDWWQEFGS